MSEQPLNRYPLQFEDALRIQRLSEEVRGRLLEIALIVSRTVGLRLGSNPVIKFAPCGVMSKTQNAETGMARDWVEVIDVDGVEACYGEIGGQSFAESPCGAGHPI
jgi:hypothetical protein